MNSLDVVFFYTTLQKLKKHKNIKNATEFRQKCEIVPERGVIGKEGKVLTKCLNNDK